MATVKAYWRCHCTLGGDKKVATYDEYRPLKKGEKKGERIPRNCKNCGKPMQIPGYTVKDYREGGYPDKTFPTFGEAEDRVREIDAEIRAGKTPQPEGEKMYDWPTAIKVHDLYLDDLIANNDLCESSKSTYAHRIKVILASPSLRGKYLNDLTTQDVKRFRTECLNAGKKLNTVNDYTNTIKQIFRALCEGTRPSLSPKLFDAREQVYAVKTKNGNSKTIFLETEDEIDVFLDICAKLSPYLHRFVFVLLNSGLRHTEALTLKMSYIHFDIDRILAPKVKGNKPLDASLSPKLKAFLLELLESGEVSPDGYIFPSKRSKSGHLSSGSDLLLSVAKEEAAQYFEAKGRVDIAARFRELTAHTLRHTFATWWEGSDKDLSQNMGHSNVKITRRIYQHVRKTRQQEAHAASVEKMIRNHVMPVSVCDTSYGRGRGRKRKTETEPIRVNQKNEHIQLLRK